MVHYKTEHNRIFLYCNLLAVLSFSEAVMEVHWSCFSNTLSDRTLRGLCKSCHYCMATKASYWHTHLRLERRGHILCMNDPTLFFNRTEVKLPGSTLSLFKHSIYIFHLHGLCQRLGWQKRRYNWQLQKTFVQYLQRDGLLKNSGKKTKKAPKLINDT